MRPGSWQRTGAILLRPEPAPIYWNHLTADEQHRRSNLLNKALEPLKVSASTGLINELSGMLLPDALIIFIDDVALCPEDNRRSNLSTCQSKGAYDLCL